MDASQAVHTYLSTAPESQFAGSSVAIIDHWQGSENLLWRVESAGRQAVLKLFIDAGQVRSRRQFEAQQLFYPAGFAARPRWYDWQPEGLARPVLIYDWVDGAELDIADSATLLETARILATVHAAGVEEVGRLSPNPVSLEYYWRLLQASITAIDGWLERESATVLHATFRALAEATSAVVQQALPVHGTATPAAIHGDPKLENFAQAGGEVTLLDWERFGLGDPALEVATFLFQHQASMDAETETAWLLTYLSHATAPDIERRIDIYRRIVLFQSACYLLEGLRKIVGDPETLAQHQANLPFLEETLAATLTQTADRLGIDIVDIDIVGIDSNVSELFEQRGM